MLKIAQKQTEDVLHRLTKYVADSGHTYREIAEMTKHFDAPYRLFHSSLSEALRGAGVRYINLNQVSILCSILNIDLASLAHDYPSIDVAKTCSRILLKLSRLNTTQLTAAESAIDSIIKRK